eukprot:PhF_6_TR40701/c0_g1_i1/m.61188
MCSLESTLHLTWAQFTGARIGGSPTEPLYYKFQAEPDVGYVFVCTNLISVWTCSTSLEEISFQMKQQVSALDMNANQYSDLISRCFNGYHPDTKLTLEQTTAPDGSITLIAWLRTILHVSKAAQITVSWQIHCSQLQPHQALVFLRDHVILPSCATVQTLHTQVTLYRTAIVAKDREIQSLVDSANMGLPPRRTTPTFNPEKFETEFLHSREIKPLLENPNLSCRDLIMIENIQRMYAAPICGIKDVEVAPAPTLLPPPPPPPPPVSDIPPPSHYDASSLPPPAPPPAPTRYTSYVETPQDRERRLAIEQKLKGGSVPSLAVNSPIKRPLDATTPSPTVASSISGGGGDKSHAKKVKKALS